MAARRKYNVKGTKDFIVLAGIFFFLCIWAIKDAWYPSEKTLAKHPRSVEAYFSIDGTLKDILAVGDPVIAPTQDQEPTLLASLSDVELTHEFEAKAEAYKAMEEKTPEKEAMLKDIGRLKEQLKQHKLFCPELGNEKGGKVKEVLVDRYDKINSGQAVMVIEPKQGFYLFNKSLAIFSFIAFWIFLALHILTS